MIPLEVKVRLVGALVVQAALPATGAVAVSVSRYPVTPTLSVAVKTGTGTVNVVLVAGIVNPVTTGTVATSLVALRPAEIFPAASLAQAYRVFTPLVAKT